MKVIVEQPLRDYMINHDHHVLTVQTRRPIMTLANRQPRTKVRYGPPQNVDRFDAYRLDDITVYVQNSIQAEQDTLDIKDRRILGIHRCQVEGLKREETDLRSSH